MHCDYRVSDEIKSKTISLGPSKPLVSLPCNGEEGGTSSSNSDLGSGCTSLFCAPINGAPKQEDQQLPQTYDHSSVVRQRTVTVEYVA